jgi:outer membrane immunogenic protein
MKKFALSVAALALSAAGAFAADLPSRKAEPYLPPPPPPPPMWTGFYAGLNAGYGFGTNSNTQSIASGYHGYNYWNEGYEGYVGGVSTLGAGLALSGVGNNSNQNGFIGGGQVGYNYQWGPSFVIGIEADIQGTGIRGNSRTVGVGGDSTFLGYSDYEANDFYNLTSTASGTTSVHAGVDWMGTVRGRLGYLFTPTMLVYATGGLTYGGVYANVNNYAVATSSADHFYDGVYDHTDGSWNHTFVGGGNKSSTLVGWNVGGGLEWMFMPNWSLKAEAIYWNMGNMTLPTVSYAVAPESGYYESSANPSSNGATAIGATRVNYQGVIARAGVNYHFNWFAPAPVVAKY